MEGRPQTKENMEELNSGRTQSRGKEKNGLDRVREAARKDKGVRFTALLHHVNIERLRSSYQSLRKGAAAGVDGETWEEYGEGLEGRLADLHGRLHRGAYRAKPSRRVWIPKADGRQRPLGIAALEDKIVQHAIGAVVRGYFQYHAVPGNEQRLRTFRNDVQRRWLRQLRRQSQRSRWTWARFQERLGAVLPQIEILHPWPNERFAAKHPR